MAARMINRGRGLFIPPKMPQCLPSYPDFA
jgi:hypothetical protein